MISQQPNIENVMQSISELSSEEQLQLVLRVLNGKNQQQVVAKKEEEKIDKYAHIPSVDEYYKRIIAKNPATVKRQQLKYQRNKQSLF